MNMKFQPGQFVLFKNYTAEIEFCFTDYKDGKNAYTIKFMRGKTELHRLCFEEELCECDQISINDIYASDIQVGISC